MIKRILVCLLSLVMTVIVATSAFAASTGDVIPLENNGQGSAAYSIVSAAVNREYDFKDDFHDSYLYDDDFYTEGIFRLDDYNGDVTITLKNNATGDEFVYEKEPEAEWSVKASVDHLLYETSQIDASVHIYDLGGDYGITEVDIPVEITVVSSYDSACFHKYPSYDCSYTAMYEGEDFTVDHDASASGGKATITLLKQPWLFSLTLYNVETGQAEDYDPEDHEFEFPTEVEVDDYDPESDNFWFFIPGKLIMDDGYVFDFTMSVNGFRKKAETTEATDPASQSASENAGEGTKPSKHNAATADSAGSSSQNSNAVTQSAGAVQTGEPGGAVIFTVSLMIISAFVAFYIKKRKNVL